MKLPTLALSLFVLSSVVGPVRAEAELKIDSIKVMAFDRQKNEVVPLNKIPNPFGADSDIVVSVLVKGEPGEPPPAGGTRKISIEMSSPAYSDEASGSHGPWKLRMERSFRGVGETGASYYPFLMPYDCRMKVTITAHLGLSSKTTQADFACAE
jgi:hypothetical protein